MHVCVCVTWIAKQIAYSCVLKHGWSHLLRDLSADSVEGLQRLSETTSFEGASLEDCRAEQGGPASVGHVSEAPAPASCHGAAGSGGNYFLLLSPLQAKDKMKTTVLNDTRAAE